MDANTKNVKKAFRNLDKYDVLKYDLISAMNEAEKHRDDDDNGTCNFDSPALDYRECGMSITKTKEAIEKAGLRCFEWTIFRRKLLVICGFQCGQAERRSRMAEAFCNRLVALGYPATMYYQMD